MDVHEDLVVWLRKMGYDGEIPESLICVCNNSTSFIWEQLMQNLKPKQEVEHIRKNIVLNRLKSKPLERQDEFLYQVDAIEIFKRKQTAQQKLKLLKEEVQEKQFKADKLAQNCKIQGSTIEHLKRKIKENEQRHYLLDLKRDDLQKKCLQAEQTLKDIKNITPIEIEESVGTQDKIMETLEKCAKKLEDIVNKKFRSLSKNPQKNFVQQATSVKKKPLNSSTIASYLDKTEKDSCQQICSSNKFKENEKENFPSNQQVQNVKKALFLQPPDIRVETVDGSVKTIAYDKIVKVTEYEIESSVKISEHFEVVKSAGCARPKKRESLGLLPESCLSDFDEEEFLQPNSLQKLETFNESDEIFMSMINSNINRTESDSDSITINIKPVLKKQQGQDNKVKEDVYNNPAIRESLATLIHTNNRQMIYNSLQNLIGSVILNFTKLISSGGSIEESRTKISEEDITRLQFVHVQTEVDILNQKRIIKELLAKIRNAKIHILGVAKSKNDKEVQEILNNKINQVGLDASLASMKKEIDITKSKEDNKELQLTTLKIAKVKDEIANKMSQIQSYINEIYKVQKQLVATREEALGPVWNLRLYKNDESWSQPLNEGLWSQEMKVFEIFPLEYNRKCTFTDSKTFYKDLCVENYPVDSTISTEELQMINELLESPFSPPETVLLNLVKSKMKLDMLKSIRTGRRGNENIQYKKYSFDELLHQENYLNFAIEKLQSVMYSQTSRKTLAIGDVVKKTMEIWSEMPMKEFISTSRLYEGETYQFYDRKLRALCG